VRISWLAPDVIAAARTALRAAAPTWSAHFTPEFVPPPPPPDLAITEWPHVAEHVARAERVTEVLVAQGLEEALRQFAASPFAIEVATLAAAAHEVEQLSFELVTLVLRCDIDDLVFYAPFLRFLVDLGGNDHERVIDLYEEFTRSYQAAESREANWRDRVAAVVDGLAGLYVMAGRIDDGHALFQRRHEEDQGDVAVALSASRTFLAAGVLSRAIQWLEIGQGRARLLGRDELAKALGEKQTALRKRQS
jgi:hypothetical protein